MSKAILVRILPVALLVLLVLVFLWKGAVVKGVFFGADEVASDLLHFSYPYREYWANEYLKRAQVPIWNQYLASGLPFLAEAQTGVFYPLSIILYRFLPVPHAFNWLIISSFIMVAIGTYLYSRKLGLASIYAFFSSLVFSLSGFMVARVRHVPVITAVAFMPFIFLASEYLLEKARVIWLILLSILIAFSFFAGHLSTTYLILLILVVYFLVRFWLISRDQKKERLKPVILFAAALVLSLCLSAVQLLPSLELVGLSTRSEGDIQVLSLPYDLKHLILFLRPYALGDPSRGTWNMGQRNYWENIGYLGILPLLLAILGLLIGLRRKNRVVAASAVILGLSFLLMLGQNTPLYNLFWAWVPGFAFTRIPGRFILFIDFFASVLAGWGLFYLTNLITNLKRRLFVLASILVISIIDLFIFGYGFNNVMPLAYFSPPRSLEFLKKDKTLFRIRVLKTYEASWQKAWAQAHGWRGNLSAYLAQRENLPGDLSLLYRFSTPSLIYALNGHFSPLKPNLLDDVASVELFRERARGAKILGLMNVKYIISAEKFSPGEVLSLVYQDEKGEFPTYIYENKRVLPRAFIVARATSYPNDKQVLSKLLSDEFPPEKEILLESEVEKGPDCRGGKANIQRYEDTKVEIKTESLGRCFLFLADTFYPGWQAYIDGQETKILLANYVYRAVPLGEGVHSVVFSYEPLWLKLGLGISLVGLGMITVILSFLLFSKIRRLWGL